MSHVPSPKKIRTPAELADVLRELEQAVANGQLEQVRPDPSPFATDSLIAEMSADGPWPDYIELRFRVPGVGSLYKLSVETFHGVGGVWSVE